MTIWSNKHADDSRANCKYLEIKRRSFMGKFLFVMTRGIEDPTRVTRALQLAKVAKEQDHDVNIFLTDDAVVIAKPGMVDQVKAPTGDEAKPYLDFLIEKEVPIYV
jgi:predicted peroxiredoxin